jgi:predicted RNA polymerase sigma factor
MTEPDSTEPPATRSEDPASPAGTGLLRRLDRDEEAAAAYHVARSITANPVEQAFLDAQHAAVLPPGVD